MSDKVVYVDGHPFLPWSPERVPGDEGLRRLRAFREELDGRRSVRFFRDEDVPRAMIEQAILAASTAPSGAHKQPWTFVAVRNADVKRRIREAAEEEERRSYAGRMSDEWLKDLAPLGTDADKPFLETVPWLVVVFMQRYGIDDAGEHRKHYYVRESVGIACGMFIAALHRAGLATLTHTPSPMKFLGDILERPRNEQAYIVFPVGYPADDCVVPDIQRKTLDEVAVFLE